MSNADRLSGMRSEFAAKRFDVVIARGNALLESSQPLNRDQRMQLWQLLAAAYYPSAPEAQQPDSARLPLEALMRLAPDATIAPELSWPGLDSLLAHTRTRTFAVVTRPLSEYTIARDVPAHVTVVATRAARFRLTSVALGSGATILHDTAYEATAAALRLRSHDEIGPIFAERAYRLEVWAFDLLTGDSVLVAHQATAEPLDAPPPLVPATPVTTRPAPDRTRTHITPPRTVSASPGRLTMLVGGVALAGASVAIANAARADEPLRSTFRVDARAFAVSAAMVAAAAAAFVQGRPRTARVVAEAPPSAAPAPPVQPPPVERDLRVLLRIDVPER